MAARDQSPPEQWHIPETTLVKEALVFLAIITGFAIAVMVVLGNATKLSQVDEIKDLLALALFLMVHVMAIAGCGLFVIFLQNTSASRPARPGEN